MPAGSLFRFTDTIGSGFKEYHLHSMALHGRCEMSQRDMLLAHLAEISVICQEWDEDTENGSLP